MAEKMTPPGGEERLADGCGKLFWSHARQSSCACVARCPSTTCPASRPDRHPPGRCGAGTL